MDHYQKYPAMDSPLEVRSTTAPRVISSEDMEELSYTVPTAGQYHMTSAAVSDKPYNNEYAHLDDHNSYYSGTDYPMKLPSTEKRYLGIRKRTWTIILCVTGVIIAILALLIAFLYPRNPTFTLNSFYVPTTEQAAEIYAPSDLGWVSGIKFTSTAVNLTSRTYSLDVDMGMASNVTIYSANFVKLKLQKIDISGRFYDSKGALISGDKLNITGRYVNSTTIKRRSSVDLTIPVRVQYDSGVSISDLLSDPVTELMINSCSVSGLLSSTSGKNMSVLLTVVGTGTLLGFTQKRTYVHDISFSCPEDLQSSMQSFVTQVALGLTAAAINQTASVISNVTSQILSSTTNTVQDNLGDLESSNNYNIGDILNDFANGLASSTNQTYTT